MTSACPVHGKKIAFVTCGYPLDVSSMLINSIALLSTDNRVEVIVSSLDSRHALCPKWLRAFFVYAPQPKRNIVYRGLRKACRIGARCLPRRLASIAWWLNNFGLLEFSLWFRRKAKKNPYDIVIAVECHALVAVASVASEKCDLLYYNMELLDWSPTNPLYEDKLTLKKFEHAALCSVARVLITSPNRAEVFAKINAYPPGKISILPVVPRQSDFASKSAYFQNLFAIPSGKRIVLYSGNFMPWALCLEIIESMATWPADTVLVMHTWNKNSLNSEYFKRMQVAAKNRPVFFSSDYLPYAELSTALSSADVGLLFYEAIDSNFTEILFSSNKFGEYMAAGLPVICSPFPSLLEFVEEQKIGRAVPVESIGAALHEIFGKLDVYRERVALCRNDFFNFDHYFAKAFAPLAEASSKGWNRCK